MSMECIASGKASKQPIWWYNISQLHYTHEKLIKTHTLAEYSLTCTSRLKMPTKFFRMLFGGKRLDTMSKCCMVQNCSRFARSSNC